MPPAVPAHTSICSSPYNISGNSEHHSCHGVDTRYQICESIVREEIMSASGRGNRLEVIRSEANVGHWCQRIGP